MALAGRAGGSGAFWAGPRGTLSAGTGRAGCPLPFAVQHRSGGNRCGLRLFALLRPRAGR